MSPIIASRILLGLLVLNEALVAATSKSEDIKSINVPVITRFAAILFLAPLFFALDYPAGLGWLIVALQAGGLVMEVLAELQLMRSRSFSVAAQAATNIQRRGMYRFLENPVYLGIMLQMFMWGLWMPLALIPAVLFFMVVRGMVAGERAFLLEKHDATHRGIDSRLWN